MSAVEWSGGRVLGRLVKIVILSRPRVIMTVVLMVQGVPRLPSSLDHASDPEG